MAGHDNGLGAASYAPLADVDPPVVHHVLEVLREAGVAAYAEPWAGETEPYRNVRPPTSPQLRVYVDRTAVPLAREVVGRALPGLRAAFLADAAARADREVMAAADVDAAWNRIVAGWDDSPGVGRWSAAEDVEERPAGSGLSERLVRRADRDPDAADPHPGRADADGPSEDDDDLDVWVERVDDADDEPADDPDDHYAPPPPPPLPQPDTVARFAWAGVLGGPGLLLVSGLFGLSLPTWVGLLALVGFVAGFVTLVARMKDRPDDGWDDGAVV